MDSILWVRFASGNVFSWYITFTIVMKYCYKLGRPPIRDYIIYEQPEGEVREERNILGSYSDKNQLFLMGIDQTIC